MVPGRLNRPPPACTPFGCAEETTLLWMIGYEVALSGGKLRRIVADRYAVGDDGAIQFFGGEALVDQLAPEQWLQVAETGIRLAEVWPPPNLALVMDAVAERLGVHYGCYVHALGDLTRFEGWQMNDLDEFCAAIFEAVDENPCSSDIREWVADIRDLVSRGFHLQL